MPLVRRCPVMLCYAGCNSTNMHTADVYTGATWLSVEKQRCSAAVRCSRRLPAKSERSVQLCYQQCVV